jgi:hypothetical protein
MQERGKTKPQKKKHLPREEKLKNKKKHVKAVFVRGEEGVQWRSCCHGIRPETSGSTLGSPSEMLDMSTLAHVTAEELYQFVQQRLIGIDGESFTHAKHAVPKGILHEIFPDNNRLEEPESRTR